MVASSVGRRTELHGPIRASDGVLHEGAASVAVRAVDAAVAGLRRHHELAGWAVVEEHAPVDRHGLARDVAAPRAGDPDVEIGHQSFVSVSRARPCWIQAHYCGVSRQGRDRDCNTQRATWPPGGAKALKLMLCGAPALTPALRAQPTLESCGITWDFVGCSRASPSGSTEGIVANVA